jgi:hypothetical protein
MALKPSREREDSLTVKLGSWFEAQATGKGVIALPIVVLVVAAAIAAARVLLVR